MNEQRAEYDLIRAYLKENFTKYKILNWEFDGAYVSIEYYSDKNSCSEIYTVTVWEVMAWLWKQEESYQPFH